MNLFTKMKCGSEWLLFFQAPELNLPHNIVWCFTALVENRHAEHCANIVKHPAEFPLRYFYGPIQYRTVRTVAEFPWLWPNQFLVTGDTDFQLFSQEEHDELLGLVPQFASLLPGNNRVGGEVLL